MLSLFLKQMFHFRFTESRRQHRERLCTLHTVSPTVTAYLALACVTATTLMPHMPSTKLHTLSTFLSFPNALFCSGSPSRRPQDTSSSALLGLLWPVTSLAWMTLSSTEQIFCQMPFDLGLSEIFLVVRLGSWIWEEGSHHHIWVLRT